MMLVMTRVVGMVESSIRHVNKPIGLGCHSQK
jgi:hypothetical protein